MSSKQLDSILSRLPSATAQEKKDDTPSLEIPSPPLPLVEKKTEPMERIVAVIPKELKDQIKQKILENKGETEKSIILKGLKSIGFNVKEDWLIDKRTLR